MSDIQDIFWKHRNHVLMNRLKVLLSEAATSCSIEKAISKNFAIFTGVLESLFSKVAGLQVYNFIKKETPTRMFFCEYCEI